MICHCFLRPIRRDLTSSSYTTRLSLGGSENPPFLLIKIRPIFIPTRAIANNGVTIRDLIGRDEKTLDCKTVVFFFLKISKEIGKAWQRASLRPFV